MSKMCFTSRRQSDTDEILSTKMNNRESFYLQRSVHDNVRKLVSSRILTTIVRKEKNRAFAVAMSFELKRSVRLDCHMHCSLDDA
jgi:hypothetical protein